jgi:hypothetical protein
MDDDIIIVRLPEAPTPAMIEAGADYLVDYTQEISIIWARHLTKRMYETMVKAFAEGDRI